MLSWLLGCGSHRCKSAAVESALEVAPLAGRATVGPPRRERMPAVLAMRGCIRKERHVCRGWQSASAGDDVVHGRAAVRDEKIGRSVHFLPSGRPHADDDERDDERKRCRDAGPSCFR